MDEYTDPHPSRAALVTIDVQRDFTPSEAPATIEGTAVAVARMAQLVAAFRRHERPIVQVVCFYRADGSTSTRVDARRSRTVPRSSGREAPARNSSRTSRRRRRPRSTWTGCWMGTSKPVVPTSGRCTNRAGVASTGRPSRRSSVTTAWTPWSSVAVTSPTVHGPRSTTRPSGTSGSSWSRMRPRPPAGVGRTRRRRRRRSDHRGDDRVAGRKRRTGRGVTTGKRAAQHEDPDPLTIGRFTPPQGNPPMQVGTFPFRRAGRTIEQRRDELPGDGRRTGRDRWFARRYLDTAPANSEKRSRRFMIVLADEAGDGIPRR